MRCLFNAVNFLSDARTYNLGKNKITETLNDGKLTKRIEYDEFDRDVDVKWFDTLGNISAHLHKDYYETDSEKGLVETFKNSAQNYVRKVYTKFESGLRHNIDEYVSKSDPQASYINDFIYDLNGKFIKLISHKK